MTIIELLKAVKNGDLRRLPRLSWHRGYVSRKSGGRVVEYHGRFGDGWALLSPSWESTRYCRIQYFVR